MEAETLENLAVFGLGEDAERSETAIRAQRNQARNQGRCKPAGTGLFGYCHALYGVAPEPAAGKDGALGIARRQIQINFLKGQTVVLKEAFNFIPEARNAKRQFLYFNSFKCFHHSAGFPILPVPPAIGDAKLYLFCYSSK